MIRRGIIQDCQQITELAVTSARGFFRNTLGVDFKDDESPVTHADKTIERIVRQAIVDRHPTHGILGEEHGIERSDHDEMWVVDPIDGTKEFIKRNGEFTVNIALVEGGVPVGGVVMFSANYWFSGYPLALAAQIFLKRVLSAAIMTPIFLVLMSIPGVYKYVTMQYDSWVVRWWLLKLEEDAEAK